MAVRVVALTPQDWRRTFAGTATLEPLRSATVVAQVPGEVLEVWVEEGDGVQKGQLLARLDAQRARLLWAQEHAQERRLGHQRDRQVLLQEHRLVSPAIAEQARFDHEAQAAQADLSRLAVEWAEIRAPMAGTITRRHIQAGQTLALHQAAFDVADLSELQAELSVPEGALHDLNVGQTVELQADAFPGQGFQARVDRTGPVVDGASGTAAVTLAVVPSAVPLRPGQLVRATVLLEHGQSLAVPSAAVLGTPMSPHVFTAANGVAHRHPVVLGPAGDAGLRVVQSGLTPGQLLVILGQDRLEDGAAVEVIAAVPDRPPPAKGVAGS